MNKLEFLPDFESFSEFHFILFLCFYLQILSNTRARSKKLASLQGKRALAYLFTFSQFLKNQNKKQATLKSENCFDVLFRVSNCICCQFWGQRLWPLFSGASNCDERHGSLLRNAKRNQGQRWKGQKWNRGKTVASHGTNEHFVSGKLDENRFGTNSVVPGSIDKVLGRGIDL